MAEQEEISLLKTKIVYNTIRWNDLKPFEMAYILRRRTGATQSELARSAGCSRTLVSRMEHGRANYGILADYWQL